MDFEHQLERIKYIDHLVTTKAACSVNALSDKLGISGRQVRNTITLMKALGAPIKYCPRRKGYFFEENKKFSYGYQ